MKNNIVLCGFMGCGKSTVGKLLAQKLDYTFCDSDAVIEENEKCSISDIFALHGETHFRSLERSAIKELSRKSGLVIATGGGAVLDPYNAEVLRETGLVIFLDITPETVIKRLEGDTTRPLLMREDKDTAVKELMAYRKPLYKKAAHFTVNAEGDAESVAKEILEIYG